MTRFDLWALLQSVKSNQVPVLPNSPVIERAYECDCKPQYGLGGIFAIISNSGLQACKNPDNESNNIAFINRK